MGNQPSILIIDDEPQIQRFLRITLEAHGFRVHTSSTGLDGITQVAMVRPEVIILDLGLPDQDGMSVLAKLREFSKTPVIVLSVRNSENDKIAALDAGADDYLTKPFSAGELIARVKVALRHATGADEEPIFRSGSLMVDLTSRTVQSHGEPVRLTATEYALLQLFIRNAGKVITHSHILREIWGPSFVDESQYLRVYVRQLRQKLEDDPSQPKIFITESGVGYRLMLLPEE